ncbi:hypothetical protein EBU99_02465 [bacterium]|nr:hypothetical protein [bacterium]
MTPPLTSKKIAGLLLVALAVLELLPNGTPLARAETFKPLSTDSADHSCQVILRSTNLRRNAETGLAELEKDALGESWFTFDAQVDASVNPLRTGATVQMLYRGSGDNVWHAAPSVAIPGAAPGLQRHSFRLAQNSLKAGVDATRPLPNTTLFLIPFLQTSDGRRIFDHNAQLANEDSYKIDAGTNWTYTSKPDLCPIAGRGSSTVRFLSDWTIEQRGQIQPAQSLFVEYDLKRLPQCQSSSYNGLPAWQTEAFVRFYPNGEEFSAALNTLQQGQMQPIAARFEVPTRATHAQLWFHTRGRNCEGAWDSNYGQNYEFQSRAGAASAPAWAGEWRLLTSSGSDCSTLTNPTEMGEVYGVSEKQLSTCNAVEAEVLVPGLTTSFTANPEAIQAQVVWKIDSGAGQIQWLKYVGRSGQNYRFRWILPTEILSVRPWRSVDYSFQFSTDGLFWLNAGRDKGGQIGQMTPRRLEFRGE